MEVYINKVAFIIISTILMFVVPILTVIIVDKIDKRKSSSLYNDDVKNFGYACERKKLIDQIDKDLHDKRRYYVFCIKDKSRLTSILHRITLRNLTVSIQCIVKNSVIHLKKLVNANVHLCTTTL